MPRSAARSFKGTLRWGAMEAREAIAAQRSSGLSTSAFALREGLDPNRLRKWMKKLERSTGLTTAATFIEVARVASGPIEIMMPSGVTVRVAETIDALALARIVHALESAERC